MNIQLLRAMGGFDGGKIKPPSILNDGNTAAWYDASDLSTITVDANNKVSLWKDKLKSGNDLSQSNALRLPTLTETGVVFYDAFMKSNAFVLEQPTKIYVVFRQLGWKQSNCLVDGYTTGTGTIIQHPSSAKIACFNSTTDRLALGNFSILRYALNAGIVGKIDYATAISATGQTTTGMGGITLGAYATSGLRAYVEFKEVIIRRINDTADDDLLIWRYLRKKHFNNVHISINGDSIGVLSAPHLQKIKNYDLVNLSIGGRNIALSKKDWLDTPEADRNMYNYVFVAVGINDYAKTSSAIITELQDYVNTIRLSINLNCKIILTTLTPARGHANWSSYYDKWLAVNESIMGLGSTPIIGVDGRCNEHTIDLDDGNGYLKAEYDNGDHLHPNLAGATLIGTKYGEMIQ